jgi:integrase/recombinase XerD
MNTLMVVDHTLRQRMTADMASHNVPHARRQIYLNGVIAFTRFLGRSPGTATVEDVRGFCLHLSAIGEIAVERRPMADGLTFFFKITMDREDLAARMAKSALLSEVVPSVLLWDEVISLLKHVTDINQRLAICLACLLGLNAEVLVRLAIDDIDSAQMLLWLQSGRFKVPRGVTLYRSVLTLIRIGWQVAYRQGKVLKHGLLMPGPDPTQPMKAWELGCAVQVAARHAGIEQPVKMQMLHRSLWCHLEQMQPDVGEFKKGLRSHKKQMAHSFELLVDELISEVLVPAEIATKVENPGRAIPPRDAMNRVGPYLRH